MSLRLVAEICYFLARVHELLSRSFEFNFTGFGDPLRRIQNLQGKEVSLVVVVENDARFVFIAFCNLAVLSEDNGEGVGVRVISDFHS